MTTVSIIGNRESTFILEEVNVELKYNVEYLSIVNLTNSINNMFTIENKYIIVDIKAVDDDNKNLIESLTKINNISPNKLIILAFGFNLDSDILSQLINNGVTNIINSNVLTKQKQLLKEALKGAKIKATTNISASQTKFRTTENKPLINLSPKRTAITIGVFGSMPRIGTTTQAIQMVKYLTLCGYNSCYVQMNNSDFIQDHLNFYEDNLHDENQGKITLFNTDFFYKKEEIPNIYNMKYDYIVFDYGTFDNIDNSFLDKDYRICVTGTKPNEINTTYPVITKFQSDENLNYIFSFTPINIREQILSYMEDRKDNTYFANISQDMFDYNGENEQIYSKILNPNTKQPAKKSFIKKVMKK